MATFALPIDRPAAALHAEVVGPTLGESKRRVCTQNYRDKGSHFSKNNVILGNGVVKLHYEKKPGFTTTTRQASRRATRLAVQGSGLRC